MRKKKKKIKIKSKINLLLTQLEINYLIKKKVLMSLLMTEK